MEQDCIVPSTQTNTCMKQKQMKWIGANWRYLPTADFIVDCASYLQKKHQKGQ